MAKKDWPCHDVEWHLPGAKITSKPIAYSTAATKYWIDIMTDEGLTIDQMIEKTHYDSESTRVLLEYRKRGFGRKNGKEMGFEGYS